MAVATSLQQLRTFVQAAQGEGWRSVSSPTLVTRAAGSLGSTATFTFPLPVFSSPILYIHVVSSHAQGHGIDGRGHKLASSWQGAPSLSTTHLSNPGTFDTARYQDSTSTASVASDQSEVVPGYETLVLSLWQDGTPSHLPLAYARYQIQTPRHAVPLQVPRWIAHTLYGSGYP